jgi:tetratricopeptide (TPR) repeat protein
LKWLSTIQVDNVNGRGFSSGAHFDGTFRVTINRILLGRAIEESEGYTELGMLEHALHALQRRGTLVHANGKACYLLGEALRELGRYEEALLPLQRSADLLPDDIHVWLALGWCYKRTGQLARAIDALERAVSIDPSEGVLHYNLACYWSLARNRALALGYLSRALEIDCNFRDMISDEADFNSLRNDPGFIAIANSIV